MLGLAGFRYLQAQLQKPCLIDHDTVFAATHKAAATIASQKGNMKEAVTKVLMLGVYWNERWKNKVYVC